ncbi:MAG: NADH-quinone oxidoreductase subunit J [Thiobacillus sp.]|jgi:NADH-quinone oxidoreductase subunit J|uniref:NADH-quinone oxidoreductase subunit J n=1 Tax=Thiobacillus sp. TaxID=924 RepID=UPI002893A5FB|nr:NADH-quinone oxidoreductase subunit J [Thiobacillus sp.]MDT3706514.1 NADH-quinone oxidoreductase subunit J [Thiobacillus sp.]
METAFYLTAAIAIAATALAVTRHEAVHGLLYLIVSLLAVAMIFFILGAPFAAALEVIIYAGAIMVLFVFVVMLLNLGQAAVAQERRWLGFGVWIGPTLLSALLLAELLFVLAGGGRTAMAPGVVEAEAVGIALFGPYLIGVELASMLLLAGLVGAYHLGRRSEPDGA